MIIMIQGVVVIIYGEAPVIIMIQGRNSDY